jgi:hypothetical protein
MAQRPLVFVSHSSIDRALTERVCELLNATDDAGHAGFQVLVDFEDLRPNVEWPRRLIEWTVRCHAAVLLLTPDAVMSDWVLKEATLLTARRTVNPDFKLFVVKFPGVDTLLDDRGYCPLFLSMIQHVGGLDPEAIAAAVRHNFRGPSTASTPYDELVAELEGVLSAAPDSTLDLVAAKLDAIPASLTLDETDRQRAIHTIARHLVCGQLGRFKGVHEVVDAFRRTNVAVVQHILNIVSPYWIEPEAAGRLPPLLEALPRKAAAINGREVADFTAPLYIGRAHPVSALYQLIPIGGGAGDQLVAHVTAEICGFMKVRRKTSMTRDEDIIAELRDDHPVWYAVLPPPAPDQEALDELLDLFPTVTFILWTGEELSVDPPLARVEWLKPPVNLAREKQARRDYRAATNVVDSMPR